MLFCYEISKMLFFSCQPFLILIWDGVHNSFIRHDIWISVTFSFHYLLLYSKSRFAQKMAINECIITILPTKKIKDHRFRSIHFHSCTTQLLFSFNLPPLGRSTFHNPRLGSTCSSTSLRCRLLPRPRQLDT